MDGFRSYSIWRVIFAVTKPLGIYMFRVFEGDQQPLPRLFGPIERLLYRLLRGRSQRAADWTQYTLALLLFSAITLLVTYAIERLQHVLPLNPQNLARSPRISRLIRRRALPPIPTGRPTPVSPP